MTGLQNLLNAVQDTGRQAGMPEGMTGRLEACMNNNLVRVLACKLKLYAAPQDNHGLGAGTAGTHDPGTRP